MILKSKVIYVYANIQFTNTHIKKRPIFYNIQEHEIKTF